MSKDSFLNIGIVYEAKYNKEELLILKESVHKWSNELQINNQVFNANSDFKYNALIINLSEIEKGSAFQKKTTVIVVSEKELSPEKRNHFYLKYPNYVLIHGRGKKSYRWALRYVRYTLNLPILKVKYGNHIDQFGEIIGKPLKSINQPLVVVIHGGFWKYPYERDLNYRMVRKLTEKNMLVWNIEYRRITQIPFSFEEIENDVVTAISYLKKVNTFINFDLNSITIIGHSAGGYLAMRAAKIINDKYKQYGVKIKNTVSLAGILDIDIANTLAIGNNAVKNYFSKKINEDMVKQYSPHVNIPNSNIMVIHGEEDSSVPIIISDSFVDKAKNHTKNFNYIKLKKMDHMDLTKPHFPFWEKIIKMIKND